MPQNQKRRQEKLMRQRRKQKAKRKQMHRAGSGVDSTVRLIHHAREFPIFDCFINAGWDTAGLADIVIARRQPNGLITFGCYLVDTGCLGVKNAFCNANLSTAKYVEFREKMADKHEEGIQELDPVFAHQLIYEALEYAAAIGFKPHHDLDLARCVLDDRSSIPPNPDIEFGKDGKPYYFSGPNDNVNRIMNHLEKTLGMGNFHYTAHIPVDQEVYADEDWDEEEVDEEGWEGPGRIDDDLGRTD